MRKQSSPTGRELQRDRYAVEAQDSTRPVLWLLPLSRLLRVSARMLVLRPRGNAFCTMIALIPMLQRHRYG